MEEKYEIIYGLYRLISGADFVCLAKPKSNICWTKIGQLIVGISILRLFPSVVETQILVIEERKSICIYNRCEEKGTNRNLWTISPWICRFVYVLHIYRMKKVLNEIAAFQCAYTIFVPMIHIVNNILNRGYFEMFTV